MPEYLETLFGSLQRRPRPEDVAEIILENRPREFSREELKPLRRSAGSSLKKMLWKFSSMAADFKRPVAPERQLSKAHELFKTAADFPAVDAIDVEKVAEFVAAISAEIRKNPSGNDFESDRLNKVQRAEAGLDISKRQYNKLFRFLTRFEEKLDVYRVEIRKYNAGRVAKSGLATSISREDFFSSVEAACFCAYFSARSNRRSVFTNQGQDRPFDDTAKMLLDRFKSQPTAGGWRAIARVMPDEEVVSQLSDEDKLVLLADWLAILQDIAELMKSTWEKSEFRRDTMIVRRGDDSSTWNALAGAWNAARRGWLSVMLALGLDDEIERMCFGKAMRLMAADVAAWHRQSGGGVEPDTLVWAELPAPWEVFDGTAECPKSLVVAVCAKHGVNPEEKGWTMPVRNRQAVPFRPTPELVHGVVMANPALALAARRAGWFSGKGGSGTVEEEVDVIRDEHGFVLRVESRALDGGDGTE